MAQAFLRAAIHCLQHTDESIAEVEQRIPELQVVNHPSSLIHERQPIAVYKDA
jgi:hypothetical protein